MCTKARYDLTTGTLLKNKFDLKSGYNHVDIFDEHQTFLGFSSIKNGKCKLYVFTVLPFGLSTAPYIFTRVLRPLVSFWHSHGIKITQYLDDGIGIEPSYDKTKESSSFVCKTLSKAGLVYDSFIRKIAVVTSQGVNVAGYNSSPQHELTFYSE